MKKVRIIFSFIFIVIILIWLIPYVKGEVLTYRYGKEFQEAYQSIGMIDNVKCLKVMKYSDNSAEVYYIGSSGNLVNFVRKNNLWQVSSWNTVWSKNGNASEYIWPYFYHSSEGLAFFIIIGVIIASFIIVLYKISVFLIVNRQRNR